jgi:hypothetical protein
VTALTIMAGCLWTALDLRRDAAALDLRRDAPALDLRRDAATLDLRRDAALDLRRNAPGGNRAGSFRSRCCSPFRSSGGRSSPECVRAMRPIHGR